MFKLGVLLALASVSLAGCGAKVEDCSGAGAKETATTVIKQQIEKAVLEHVEGENGERRVGKSKVRATIGQLALSFEDIRTTKSDPNSTKRFCTGRLKIALPDAVITDAETAREKAGLDSINKLSDRQDVERNANSFTSDIDFNVQPTDDGEKVYAEVEDGEATFTFFGEVLASHLLRSSIESAQIAEEQAAAEQRRAEEAALAEQSAAESNQKKAQLMQAQAENKLASQTINAVWSQIPEETRTSLADIQQAWKLKKNADCVIEASSESTDPTIKEAARLACDTQQVNSRANYLRQYVGDSGTSGM
jgi:uncharacterized protein YecT (DUF1311 family)